MKITDDDFKLFGLPERFALEGAELDARRRQLQSQVHPDRFAGEGAAAQRISMQWAVRVNEAYQRLKDPLKRAAYLCELRGQAIDAERNTAMPAAFLVQQMQWREALEEAQSAPQVQALAEEVAAHQQQQMAALGGELDSASPDNAACAHQVRALMFVERFMQDIDRRLDQLDLQR